jgi:phytanoyl-CoA hydroxylase
MSSTSVSSENTGHHDKNSDVTAAADTEDGGGDDDATDDACWNEIRAHAEKVFQQLAQQANDATANIAESWVRGGQSSTRAASDDDDDDTSKEVIDRQHHRSANGRFFDYTGFLHIANFATTEECHAMKQQMADLVEGEWDATSDAQLDSFGTSDSHNSQRGDYFLESADKVHFFAEPDALLVQNVNDITDEEQNGNTRVVLKEYYRNTKIAALNKAGHALHMQDGVFRDYCLSEKVCRLVIDDLGWRDPVVPQSMYIFKQALHGGVVTSHQDSTFLYTTPRQTCLGLWLALDDANVDNGCLWVRPRSHMEQVRRQFKRNPLHFGMQVIQARGNQPAGDVVTHPKFIMENLADQHEITWEGSLPGKSDERDDYDKKNADSSGSSSNSSSTIRSLLDAGFVPVECKAGDLLAFCGQVDHLSLTNTSTRPRHTFQLHLVEGPGAGVAWSESNWLQYPDGKPFLRLLGEQEEQEGAQS